MRCRTAWAQAVVGSSSGSSTGAVAAIRSCRTAHTIAEIQSTKTVAATTATPTPGTPTASSSRSERHVSAAPDLLARRWAGIAIAGRGRPLTAIVLALLAAVVAAPGAPVIERLRHTGFDAYQRLLPRVREKAPAVIVEIDEKSLARHGQWPWPRSLIAQLVERIHAGAPFAVGLDLIFPERDRLSPRFAELIYNGFWYSPEMEFLRAAIDASQRNVTGEARLRLFKGGVQVTGRRSPVSLYSTSLVSFDEAGGYDQRDAGGFIRLQGLRLVKPSS